MRVRGVLMAGTIAAALGLGAAPAAADHHEIRIAEVFPGSSGPPDIEYVQLEMVSAGQNFFADSGSTVTMLGPTGGENLSVPLDADVANGQRGRRVLVGITGLEGTFGPVAEPDFDFLASDYLDPAAGAACFVSGVFAAIDCVAWGGYTGATPSPTGSNVSALTVGKALRRKRPACGPGVVDTNSPANWVEVDADPFNNEVEPAAFDPCPQTRILKKPKKRTTRRRARFTFTATQGVDEFKCKLDRRPFRDCTSPFRKRVKPGRHTFKVKAEGDTSPASYSWRVVKRG